MVGDGCLPGETVPPGTRSVDAGFLNTSEVDDGLDCETSVFLLARASSASTRDLTMFSNMGRMEKATFHLSKCDTSFVDIGRPICYI